MGRRDVARGSTRGGDLIPPARQIGERVALAGVALALLGATVSYAALQGDRLPELIAGVGGGGCALAAVALALRRPALFGLAVAAVGAAYAVFLGLRAGIADENAAFVAAALFTAAELGFWSLEPRHHFARTLVARRVLFTATLAVGAVLVGSLVLVVSTAAGGGVALEAVGVLAAVVLIAVVAWLATHAVGSTST